MKIRSYSTLCIVCVGSQGENKLDMTNLDNLQASGTAGHVE